MADKKKKKKTTRKKASEVDALIRGLRAEHGDLIGGVGLQFPPVARCPFGILPLDIATGGGFPLTKLTVIYGPDGIGKTTLLLKAIAEYQRRYPKKRCVFVDVERNLDTDWAQWIGVDVKALGILVPKYAEQAVDIVEQLMWASDVGLVGWDSIAAAAGKRELSGSAEDADPGGISRAINTMVRRTTLALGEGRMEGRLPTMIWINQIRSKIGVMFGNPETLPGGNGQRYMTALRLRVNGRHKVVGDVNEHVPALLETTVTIEKWRQMIVKRKETYDIVVMPHRGLRVGQTSDWTAMNRWLTDLGLLGKVTGGYQMLGEKFRTQADAWEWLRADPERLDGVVQQIIKTYENSMYNTNPDVAGGEE